jgi:hypothetical protein
MDGQAGYGQQGMTSEQLQQMYNQPAAGPAAPGRLTNDDGNVKTTPSQGVLLGHPAALRIHDLAGGASRSLAVRVLPVRGLAVGVLAVLSLRNRRCLGGSTEILSVEDRVSAKCHCGCPPNKGGGW